MNITQDDILEALRAAVAQQATHDGPAGVTGPECAKAWGLSPLTARQKLRGLLDAGLAEVVTVNRVRMDGIANRVKGYRLK